MDAQLARADEQRPLLVLEEQRRVGNAQLLERQSLRPERAERRLAHPGVFDLGVRGKQRKGSVPEVVAQFARERAREDQRAGLVAQPDQVGSRDAAAQVPLDPLVPDEALQLEERHHPQTPVDVQERSLEVARVLAQPPQDRRVPLSRRLWRAQLPLSPVFAPERLHLRVVAAVQLAGRGEKCLEGALPVASQEMPGDESLAVLEEAEALRIEVVHHARPLHLRGALRYALRFLRGEIADRDLEPVGGDVARAERLRGPADQLEPQVPRLQHFRIAQRPSQDADQLLGAALLVLEPADRQVATADRELLADPLQRLQGGHLLLVHPVDPHRPLRLGLEPVALADHEVFRTLLDLHRRARTRAHIRGQPRNSPPRGAMVGFSVGPGGRHARDDSLSGLLPRSRSGRRALPWLRS